MADKLVTFIILCGFLALVAGLVIKGGEPYRGEKHRSEENTAGPWRVAPVAATQDG